MAEEAFHLYPKSLISPLDDIVGVANPGDVDTPLVDGTTPIVSRAVYVGTAGDLAVVTNTGRAVTIKGLAAGVWHALRIKQVNSAGTTAVDILVGW